MDRLPLEIRCLIYSHLLPYIAPQVLLVSRCWRNSAYACPSLWHYVRILHSHQLASPDALSAFLERSKGHHLHVKLRITSQSVDLTPTLSLLHTNVHRFRVLSIDAPTMYHTDFIISYLSLTKTFIGNPAPKLETLTATFSEDPKTLTAVSYFENAFYPTPRLKQLALPALRLPSPSSGLLLTVTSLTISGVCGHSSVVKMLDTISATNCLTFLKYFGPEVYSYQKTSSVDYPRIIKLLHLSHLDVTVPGCGLDILLRIEAPALHSVRLDGRADDIEEWEDSEETPVSDGLRRLSQRSPSIQSIEMCHIPYLPPETFSRAIHQADFLQLENLVIKGGSLDDESLTLPGSDNTSLTKLQLQDCQNITGDVLVSWSERQNFAACNGFTLRMSGCPGILEEHLVKMGQIITVEHGS